MSERAAIITLRRGASTVGKIGLAVLLGFASAGAGPASAASLRVCADPDNMPFSNEKAEGFENKLAELIAQKLNATLQYSWFAESTGYVPNTMGREACDLVMGYAQGTGLIEDTNPYYYTSYVLIHREKDASLAGIDNLSDPRLKGKRIGLFARTPPASILAMHGLVANAKPFEVNADESAAKATMTIIDQIASGELDAALLWGPVGGYYAERAACAAQARAARQGERWPEHDLRHHHGRAARRAAMEAYDQQADRREPGRDQRDPAGL